jgi:hypothetical protein
MILNFFQRKLHVQVWSLPAEMVGLVLKRRMIFDVFVQENGKEKIALKVRFVIMARNHGHDYSTSLLTLHIINT